MLSTKDTLKLNVLIAHREVYPNTFGTKDTLKLNVLIATSIAIRIDTYKLVVVGLNTQFKEQVIDLNPTGGSDAYIKEIKKLLINQVLGTMGGYPSYLKH